MSREKLLRARSLIQSKQYDEARAILLSMPDNPTAQKWLVKLNQIAPPPPVIKTQSVREVKKGISLRVYIASLVVALIIIVAAFMLGRELQNDKIAIEDAVPTVAILPSLPPTMTSPPSLTPSATHTATATLISTPTNTPSPSLTSTATNTLTSTPLPTNSPIPSVTPLPTFTPTLDWRTAPTTTYYVISQMANVRACASTGCDVVTQVEYRAPLSVVELVSGEELGGDPLWLHINTGNSDGYIHNSVASLTEPPPPTATPSYGSLQSPYPSGSWLDFSDGSVRATRIVRPANSTVANFNMFNPPPASGSEYVLVWFDVYCNQQKCSPIGDLDIRLIDSSGQIWGESAFLVLDPDLDLMEGLQGSTLSGWQLFEFPIGRGITAIQVKWPKWFSDPLYVSP